jgi:hypothetical protein
MRLIDADALIKKVFVADDNPNVSVTMEDVDEMSTAYDIDKVVEQLEERKITPLRYFIIHKLKGETIADNPYYVTGFNRAMDVAIKIVKEGAK